MLALLYAPDADEAAVLTLLLQRAGFEVRLIPEADRLLQRWHERPAELFFLTLNDEKSLSQDLITQVRVETLAPIAVVLERADETRQVVLLEAGADLILTRPYSPRLLVAQLRALMRRSAGLPLFSIPQLSQAGLTLDPSKRSVQVGDQQAVRLTQLEFRLLYALMTHSGRVIPAENLVEYVWGYGGEGSRSLVRGLIQRLRAKIEADPSNPRHILTEPGIGYFFEPAALSKPAASKTAN